MAPSSDNITDWALDQFKKDYQLGRASTGSARRTKTRPITKEAIFHYVYGVLHDPVYREKYALNLKREFPRIPFYKDFWQWAEWGKELMDLHIGYESVTPAKLKRIDLPDEKARKAGLAPKCDAESRQRRRPDHRRQRNDANRHPARSLGLQTRQPLARWNGFSTSTKKRNPKTRPSARSSTPTASPTTRRK